VSTTLQKTWPILEMQLLNVPMSKISETFFKQCIVAMAVDGRIFNGKDLILTKLLILKPTEP